MRFNIPKAAYALPQIKHQFVRLLCLHLVLKRDSAAIHQCVCVCACLCVTSDNKPQCTSISCLPGAPASQTPLRPALHRLLPLAASSIKLTHVRWG